MQLGKAPNRLYIYGRLGSQARKARATRRDTDKLSRFNGYYVKLRVPPGPGAAFESESESSDREPAESPRLFMIMWTQTVKVT